jgi:hypothetical protein
MANKQFRKVKDAGGEIAWMHPTESVWIRKYDAISGVRAAFYQAYSAIHAVPAGRNPWSIDNRRVGTERGFPSLTAAMKAAS